MNRLVLSHYQAESLLEARRQARAVATTSPDLGLSIIDVSLSPEGVKFPAGEQLVWEEIEKIASTENNCFLVQGRSIQKIQVFSEETNRLYTLYPTPRAPTMLVSGIPMHRIKGTDPWQDTLAKIKTIGPIAGLVLDTATGLGYTAIAAAQTADEVTTVELDPAAAEIANLNPWSQPLFDNARIHRLIGDSFDEVGNFGTSSFSRIIHDPPMFKLAGDLYSEEMYRQLFRVLRHGGKLFHYVGDLESRSGRSIVHGVVKRLQQAGFSRVTPHPEAFGLTAVKGRPF